MCDKTVLDMKYRGSIVNIIQMLPANALANSLMEKTKKHTVRQCLYSILFQKIQRRT